MAQKYQYNRNFFRKIDTEATAYWLGFIAADGSVTRRQLRTATGSPNGSSAALSISLGKEDRAHLERFVLALDGDVPIREYHYPPKTPMVRLLLSSTQLVSDLCWWGLEPRKTFVHRWPAWLDRTLLRHFLRGYFDGDGSFYIDQQRERGSAVFSLTSNYTFVYECQQFLCRKELVGLNALRKQYNERTWSAVYRGNTQVKRLAEFLYCDATIWLPRKREVVAHL